MNTRSLLQTKPTSSFTPVSSRLLQRKCACGGSAGLTGKCSECESKRLTLQRRSNNQAEPDEVPPIVYEVLNSSGQPLDENTRAFMEPRFGHDFSQVRVHTDGKAAESARAVNALAYTVGRDIVFGMGYYSPRSNEGTKVLAHELTHVVQQKQASPVTQLHLGQPNDSCEQEANLVASNLDNERANPDRLFTPTVVTSQDPSLLQRLGANPTCTKAEVDGIHQAIFDARGWLNKAIPKLEVSPLSDQVLTSLRRNFGPTYGVAANATLIRDRLRVARSALGQIPFSCDTAGTTPDCAANHCGWAVPGSNAATICTNPPSTLSIAWPFAADCVLHESLHASMSFMTVDNYTYQPGYPGVGTEPLLNAASYTRLAMDLS